MSNEIPKDLAGYQQIVLGPVKAGDILHDSTFCFPAYSTIINEETSSYLNRTTGHIEDWPPSSTTVVYRKSACPKQSDSHERDMSGIAVPPPTTPYPEKSFGANHGKAKTDDDGKAPLAWLPWDGIREVSYVQAYGHKKYNDFNNFRKGMEVSRNLSCAVRHIAAYMEGESNDPESGRNHLAHATCRLLFVLQNIHDGVAIDDRFNKTNKAKG